MSKCNQSFPILLSNDGTKFAISTRTSNGQFGQPLTKDGTLEDIKDFLTDIGLLSEDVKNDSYKIDIQKMSEYLAKKLQSIIQDENHILYKKFIEYKTQGIKNDFQMNLERILDQELDSSHKISSDINHMVQNLYDNFIQLDITIFQINYRTDDSHTRQYDWQLLENFTNEFDALINMIIMSILVEYGRKDNQRYFPKNAVLQEKISSIKNNLLKAIQINQKELDEAIFCSFYSNNVLLTNYETIMGEKYQPEKFLNMIVTEDNIHHRRERWMGQKIETTIEIPYMTLTNDNEEYYSQLLDMLGKINLIEEFLNRLIDSCTKQNDITQSTKLLQLLHISNAES